jgi:hypothetical protein
MSALTVYEMLQNEIKTLPEALAEKVFDFLVRPSQARKRDLSLETSQRDTRLPRSTPGRRHDRQVRGWDENNICLMRKGHITFHV